MRIVHVRLFQIPEADWANEVRGIKARVVDLIPMFATLEEIEGQFAPPAIKHIIPDLDM